MVVAHVVGSPGFYWALVAELSLVVWTVLLLVAPGRRQIDRWRFALTAFGAAVFASLITLAGKAIEVWPGNPLFPSGHTAYVVTIAVFLVARDRRWLSVVIPLALLMAVALVLANYHVPEDIAGGAAVGVVVGASAFTWLDRRRLREQ
ncbi:MAG: phosphatase PAP2 family protein [Actinobacteria bacterium]|nr:phosphatase PAP2 family protein [Actinomycetota bacterium]